MMAPDNLHVEAAVVGGGSSTHIWMKIRWRESPLLLNSLRFAAFESASLGRYSGAACPSCSSKNTKKEVVRHGMPRRFVV